MVGPLFIAVARKARRESQLTPYNIMNALSLARTEKCSKNTKLRRRYFLVRFGEFQRSRSMRKPIPLNRRV